MNLTIRTKEATHQVECAEGDRILFAGLRAGIALPYECATGTCGTCKARTRSPDVEDLWPEAPGRVYLKAERGEILMCQARAHGDCEILVPGRPAAPPTDRIAPDERAASVVAAKSLTYDVMSFSVELDRPIGFHAGQFMVVEAPGTVGFRAYSMVNYAEQTTSLDFVVKRKPGGEFSEWLFGDQVVGAGLRLFGPLGRATFHPEEHKDLLCIAGGSGIAGMMSMLARGFRDGYFSNHRGRVFFGVRTMQDAFFLDELSRFQSMAPEHVRITVALSEEDAPDAESTPYPNLTYASGMVHQVAAEQMKGSYENTIAFVAGPAPMVDGAIRILILEGRLPAGDIRYDKFS